MYPNYSEMAEAKRAEWDALACEMAAARGVTSPRPVRRNLGLFLIKAGQRLAGPAEAPRVRNHFATS